MFSDFKLRLQVEHNPGAIIFMTWPRTFGTHSAEYVFDPLLSIRLKFQAHSTPLYMTNPTWATAIGQAINPWRFFFAC